ncbi:hypothetical protein DL766_001368 [Monosporascus sp. MC13-8B]|uniref:Uncharacterized protein n=1 Tax=Monosporascus cannonballus TaxID=155416 RepID=A0ABY0HH11_9PEZI|nr:hypothetical protein DL763_005006 [Monosporascus cannonballus]RYO93248.1 hypothetical protein DL762_001197 [Monosporascus cannonballus]RYP37719.1 hypothetical protein DL766_001368 [Monosporascus sp. MC13-8B]
MTGGRRGDDYGEPPPSPYYQAHIRPRRPLAARLLLGGWPYALLVAALAVGIYWASEIPPRSPEQSSSLPPPQQQTQTQTQQGQLKAAERTHTRQLGAPLGLNFTRDAEPLWQGYREVLLAHTDEEYYGALGFDKVDADTVLIAEMWSKVEKTRERERGDGGVDGKKYERMAHDVHVRGTALRNASVEFAHFLGNRTLVVQELLRRGVAGVSTFPESELEKLGPLLSNTGNNSSSSGSNTAAGGPPRVPTLSLNELANYDSRSTEALARTAEGLMAELIRQHQALFRPIEHGVERICRVTLPAARAAETRVIGALVAASGGQGGELWKERHKKEHGHGGSAIKKLEHGVCELDKRHKAMRRALGWLQSRFATLRGRHLEKVRVRDARGRARETVELLFWVQSAAELLNAWSTVLMDVEEGVLIELRKKDIAEEKAQRAAEAAGAGGDAVAVVDYDQSWDRWKLENCGGTSCYDKDTPLTRLKHVFFQKKPLADEARNERELLGRDVKLWKGIYEKACCENDTLAKTLKYGKRTPEFQVELEDDE